MATFRPLRGVAPFLCAGLPLLRVVGRRSRCGKRVIAELWACAARVSDALQERNLFCGGRRMNLPSELGFCFLTFPVREDPLSSCRPSLNGKHESLPAAHGNIRILYRTVLYQVLYSSK